MLGLHEEANEVDNSVAHAEEGNVDRVVVAEVANGGGKTVVVVNGEVVGKAVDRAEVACLGDKIAEEVSVVSVAVDMTSLKHIHDFACPFSSQNVYFL